MKQYGKMRPKKPLLTRPELEALIAERFGVPATRVAVRGDPPVWDATLLLPRSGNAERHARFWTLVYEMKVEFGLRG